MALNLYQLSPKTPLNRLNEIGKYINMYADKYGINTAKRLAAFVAQAVHESDGFKSMIEYGRDSYFNRYEPGTGPGRRLGNTQRGDGLKFKGRGIFQITGRWNYEYFSKKIFGDKRLLTQPWLLEQPQYAVLAAMEFWKFKKLNPLADVLSFDAITKKINGGTKGAADRKKNYNRALAMLGIEKNVLV